MSKSFKTIYEQINILHSRKLLIPDYKKAKHYLLTNNYYSIINGYSKYFMKNEKYINSVSFDEIAAAYFYDKEIKYTLFKAILEAEKHIKSILAYVFSEANQGLSYFYLDVRAYDRRKDVRQIRYVIKQIVKIIDKHKLKNNGNPINHYFKKSEVIPFWVVVDYLTFGDIVAILRVLPLSLQDNMSQKFYSFISKHFKIKGNFTPAIMFSFIENIAETRNICAHDNRLYGFRCRNSMKYYPDLHQKYNIPSNISKSTPYHTFLVLQCFLSPVEYAKLHNTLIARFKSLDNRIKSINVNIFLSELDFPNNWHLTTSKLIQ